MRRRLIDIVNVLILMAVGVSLGLGASIVYTDYLYSPYGNLTYLGVREPNSLTASAHYDVGTASKRASETSRQVASWALENKATVLFAADEGGFVVNFGAVDGSGLIERELGISGLGTGAQRGTYVRNDPAFLETYIRDSTLLPGIMNLPVLGTFESAGNMPIIEHADFLYPLELNTSPNGLVYTDAKDVDSLIALFESRGLDATVYSQPLSVSLAQLPQRLLMGSVYTQALIVAFVGLLFCFGYMTLSLYRSRERWLWVHHLYGLSLRRIAYTGLAFGALSALIQTGIFAALFMLGRSYLPEYEIARVVFLVLTILLTCGILAHAVGILWIGRRLSMRGGTA